MALFHARLQNGSSPRAAEFQSVRANLVYQDKYAVGKNARRRASAWIGALIEKKYTLPADDGSPDSKPPGLYDESTLEGLFDAADQAVYAAARRRYDSEVSALLLQY